MTVEQWAVLITVFGAVFFVLAAACVMLFREALMLEEEAERLREQLRLEEEWT